MAGRTTWVDVTERWKALAPNAFSEGPDAVAEDLAALWRGGDTSDVGTVEVVSVKQGEPAVIVIRGRDGPDEAVASVDYEINLEPGHEGWVVSMARVNPCAASPSIRPTPPTAAESRSRSWRRSSASAGVPGGAGKRGEGLVVPCQVSTHSSSRYSAASDSWEITIGPGSTVQR